MCESRLLFIAKVRLIPVPQKLVFMQIFFSSCLLFPFLFPPQGGAKLETARGKRGVGFCKESLDH